MFQLHDRTRRRLCLTAFALACVVPTAVVLTWGLARRTSWHVRAEADRLSALVGLRVSLTGMRHPRPGVVEYEGLELADPETVAAAARCRRLKATWEASPPGSGPRRPLVTLEAAQPELCLEQLGLVWPPVARLLSQTSDADVRLTAAEGALRLGSQSQPVAEIQGKLESQSAGGAAEIRFRLAGSVPSEAILVRRIRDRQTRPPTNSFLLDTGGNALLCSVLALGIPGMDLVGPRGRFAGKLSASESPDGWTGKLEGQFVEIDLEGLLGDRFPHKLSGPAQVEVQSARFRQGRLEDVTGRIVAGPGTVGRSLIDAAAQRLQLACGLPAQYAASSLRYQQLAALFHLDDRGLWLHGQCGDGNGRAILVDPYGNVLLGDPATAPQPVASLVQALVPQSSLLVPATRQADWLLRRLPLPDAPPAPPPDNALSGVPAGGTAGQ